MITRAEAVALTELLRTIRPAWDALTTINVLCALTSYDLANIAAAGVRTAQDPTMRTPQAIAFTDSEHWRPTVRKATPRVVPIWEDTARLQEIANCHWCDERGRIATGWTCTHDDPTERETRAKAHTAAARAQIRPAPRPIDTTTANGTVAALTPDRDQPRPNQQETA